MHRKLSTFAFLGFALGIIALAVGWRVILEQRKAITELRLQLDSQTQVTAPPEPSLALSSNQGPKLPASSAVPETNVVPPSPTSPPPNPGDSAVLDALRQENNGLKAQVLELGVELARTRQLVPEPDDPKEAYVGPGVWINPDGQTRHITKMEITGVRRASGNPPSMGIRAWGRCHPTDCDWGTVPLYLLNWDWPGNTYLRAFAAWDHERGSQYVILSFEKSGLKVEDINISRGPPFQQWRLVYQLTRVSY